MLPAREKAAPETFKGLKLIFKLKRALIIHCGTTFTSPTIPVAMADVSPASQVMFTWKIRTNKPPPRSRPQDPEGYWPAAVHQASPSFLPSSASTASFSIRHANTRAIVELNASFMAVNSAGVMEPPKQLSFRNTSAVPVRRKAMQSARKIGVIKFTTSPNAGTSPPCLPSRLMHTAPATESEAATPSKRPRRSLLIIRAKMTVQTRSVDWSSRCLAVGTKARPQLVIPYLMPKSKPTGATCRSLYPKCGPKIHDLPDDRA
mmetsp:Transcript_103511/g.198701  ORF Transcript_103511/g.198701 Transcript_103511/m.198701 type:complete len:261 (-) Transcript_103511:295-1077(-)